MESKFGDMTIEDCLKRLDGRAPVISRTESGYWHVRWNANQWIQWPCGRPATKEDGFGWVTDEMVAEANRITTAGRL